MMNPTPTTCIAISFDIPNNEQASGISNIDPPATPDVPQAEIVAIRLRIIAVPMSKEYPSEYAAESVITVITIEAPAIFIVAPSGIDTEYVSSFNPIDLHNRIFTGIFAADERVKNAVIKLSLRHLKTNGYGFCPIVQNTIAGFTTNTTNAIQPTKTASNRPYSLNTVNPFADTVLNTSPKMPSGAKLITQLTA
ncbi:hypothetical protein FACS1894188_07530 [Clostridia bacterium]|nr:hypothetical protein FACS1894188_07530 [Clostridia bacterium]